MNQLAPAIASQAPALVAASGGRASYRFLEFFTAQIRNPHTRRAYARAATEFFDWLEAKGVTQLAAIESVHVATYIEQLSRARTAPTVKLRLAALRHLFDWMVIGQIMPTNPAAAVRGLSHIVRRGKTPVLDAAEARQLIDAIDTATVIGLRDRALIGLMVYSKPRTRAPYDMDCLRLAMTAMAGVSPFAVGWPPTRQCKFSASLRPTSFARHHPVIDPKLNQCLIHSFFSGDDR